MAPQPSPQHVWIAGHWHWAGGGYTWVVGNWELPPVVNAVWVAPRWEIRGNGYVLVDGYWQQTVAPVAAEFAPPSAPPQVVVVNAPPPPPVREVILECQRPSSAYLWVDGYWAWYRGRHVWMAGHWERPPHSNLVWVQPRWERRGHDYLFVQGFWRDAGVMVGVGVSIGGGSSRHEDYRHEEIVIRYAPPAPRREYVRERDRPSPHHLWISGYWGWQGGRHEWVSGRWELPPRERARWIEPRWDRRRDGAYIFIEGGAVIPRNPGHL